MREYATDVFTFDQIAMKSHDPVYMKYMGRNRDWRGMSSKDYYVENDMNAGNYASPQYLKDDVGFTNKSDLGPKPLGYYLQTVFVK